MGIKKKDELFKPCNVRVNARVRVTVWVTDTSPLLDSVFTAFFSLFGDL